MSDGDGAIAGHRGRCRVGAVGAIGDEHFSALAPGLGMIGAGHQDARQLAVRPGHRLRRDSGHAGDRRQQLLQVVEHGECPLYRLGGLEGMKLPETGQGSHVLVELRVVLHRAGAERVEAGIHREVERGETGEVAHHVQFAYFGQVQLVAQLFGRQ